MHGQPIYSVCCALAIVQAACAPMAEPPRSWRGDPFADDRIFAAGPLLLGESQTVLPPRGAGEGKLPAYRVESFGRTVIEVDAWGPGVVLIVQGPLPGVDGDGYGRPPIVAHSGATRLEPSAHLSQVRLASPGVYRVVVAEQRALAERGSLTGPITLTSRCTSGLGCERESLSLEQVASHMLADGTLHDRSLGKALVAGFVPVTAGVTLGGSAVPVVSAIYYRALSSYQHHPTRAPKGRFLHTLWLVHGGRRDRSGVYPLVRMQRQILPAYLNLLDADEDTDRPVPPVQGELAALLGACDVPRSHPVVVRGRYSIGNQPDLSLTPCQVAGSHRFAGILNALALNDSDGAMPSEVTYRRRVYRSPDQLVGALLDAGHQIELLEVRSNVQLTTLTVAGKDVFWPLWLQSGLSMGSDSGLRMPLARSQIVWRIAGPDLSARVAFIVRQGGARFAPLTERAPGWVGHRVTALSTSPADVTESFRVAALYLSRDRTDSKRPAAFPVAKHGTSSDAAALLLRAVWGYESDAALPFPLLRSRQSDLMPPLRAETMEQAAMADLLAALPHDGDDALVKGWRYDARANREGLRRMRNMVPIELDAPMMELFPPQFRVNLCRLEDVPSPVCRSIMNAAPVP
jgi:hypothetical protein